MGGCFPCGTDLERIYHNNSINSSKNQIKKKEIENIMNRIDNQNKNEAQINEVLAINNNINDYKRESSIPCFPNLFNNDIDSQKKGNTKKEKLKMIEENEKSEQNQEEKKSNIIRNNLKELDWEKTNDTRKKTISFISPITIDNKLKKNEEKDSEQKSVASNGKNEEKIYFFDNEFLKNIKKSNNSSNNKKEKIKLIHFDEKNKKFKETLYNKKYFIEKYEFVEVYHKKKKFKFLFPKYKLKNSEKNEDNILKELKTSLCLEEIKKIFIGI